MERIQVLKFITIIKKIGHEKSRCYWRFRLIGSYNVKKFLSEGYKVKVSATDISKKEKYEHLKMFPNSENLEIVELNVENKSQLEGFLNGCNIVVHVGTPFQLDVKDPKTELFDPTIKGTENFLEAIQKTSGVEKVVFIASVAAYNTNFPLLPDSKSQGDQISEDDVPFMSEESHPYAQAKFIANQTVEKFITGNPNLSFEISTVSPVGVMGKGLSQKTTPIGNRKGTCVFVLHFLALVNSP